MKTWRVCFPAGFIEFQAAGYNFDARLNEISFYDSNYNNVAIFRWSQILGVAAVEPAATATE